MGETSEDEYFGGDELAYYPPSIHHTFGCADHGVWRNSCDISLSNATADTTVAPTIYSMADWSERCDPWKGVTRTRTLTYEAAQGVWVNASGHTISGWTCAESDWTCPEAMRSMSGCGDFRTDTRGGVCRANISLLGCGRPLDADRRIFSVPNIMPPQRHVCVQHPIFYDNLNTEAPVVPPARGRHRERWAKYGEYDFLPAQRWMHNLEHGSIVFLYDPCLDEESLCQLRRYIQKWQERIGRVGWGGSWGDSDDEFRFVLTPFKDLWTPISLLAWGHVYSSKCFNEQDMDYFIEGHYRNGFEDWPPDGAYDFLWRNITEAAAACAPLRPKGEDHASYMLTLQRANSEIAQLQALVATLQNEVNDLKGAMSGIKDVCRTNHSRRLGEGCISDHDEGSANAAVRANEPGRLLPGLCWLGTLALIVSAGQ